MKEINRIINSAKTLVFFDLEGTQFSQEIIAIGAVKVTLDNKNNIKKTFPGFHQLVKAHGEIGSIVTKLTNIHEEDLEKDGINFYFALKKFQKYVGNLSNVKFISYGNFDIRLLQQTMKISNLENNDFLNKIFKNYFDFTTILNKYVKSDKNENLSLLNALKVFQIEPVGDAHNPMYDAQNLMLLYGEFIKNKGLLLKNYLFVLQNKNFNNYSINKTIKQLFEKGSITFDEFKELVKKELE